MPDLEQLNKQKERILSTIRYKGPSLPVQIAKALGISPLFASVFLSELRAEGKLKVSDMRVGSSALFFLPGQESKLEDFSKYLNDREKEAFELLRKSLVLKDEEQTPVMRVALRAIKDFAVPIKVGVDGIEKTFWKYFTLSQELFELNVTQMEEGKKRRTVNEKLTEKAEIKIKEEVVEKQVAEESEEPVREFAKVNEIDKIKGAVEKKPVENFSEVLRDYLSGKDIEIMEVFVEKKKEFEAKVRIDIPFGKQEFYLVAKDKKGVSEKDLQIVWSKAHSKKLPALFVSPGELNKKGKEHLREWKNLVKFEKLKA